MEQFSLEKWLQDKSQEIVTRDGREVSIERTDLRGHFPILAIISNNSEDYDIPMTYNNKGKNIDTECEGSADLFFADKKKTNNILDELKSYLKNTPKEQVEKDWKEIQDWYVQQFTNEKHDGEEELTEFRRTLSEIIDFWQRDNGSVLKTQSKLRSDAKTLIDLAKKEIEKEHSEFKPKFTYNEKNYSELANKLIEFRNNTPLCSVSYRDGEGRKVILHYEKEIIELVKNEILKDLPKWKKATEYKDFKINEACILDDDIYPIIATSVNIGEYYIELDELKNLPLEK